MTIRIPRLKSDQVNGRFLLSILSILCDKSLYYHIVRSIGMSRRYYGSHRTEKRTFINLLIKCRLKKYGLGFLYVFSWFKSLYDQMHQIGWYWLFSEHCRLLTYIVIPKSINSFTKSIHYCSVPHRCFR